MRRLSLNLALFACCLSSSALGTTRHIRSTLDDVEAGQVSVLPESQVDFPLTVEPASGARGRLIRTSLDDEAPAYGRLPQAHPPGRHFRTTLD